LDVFAIQAQYLHVYTLLKIKFLIAHFNYLINFDSYVFEPFEIKIFNTFVSLTLIVFLYSTVAFLPIQLLSIYEFLSRHVTIKLMILLIAVARCVPIIIKIKSNKYIN